MGNAGGFSSVGPSTPVGSISKHDNHGNLQGPYDEQLQELAKTFDVSKAEMQVLWQRFNILGPGDDGILNRAVFQRPPYCEDIFCRQIWKRFSGSKIAPHQISFESFARSMIWWQKAPISYKLQLLFSWMRDVDGITPHVLAKILKHILSDYDEDELKLIAEKMISTISPMADPLQVKEGEFQQWIGQLPEEALRDALHFKILHIDAGTKS